MRAIRWWRRTRVALKRLHAFGGAIFAAGRGLNSWRQLTYPKTIKTLPNHVEHGAKDYRHHGD